MANSSDVPRQSRRPLFAGGERLRKKIEPAGGGGPKWHPRTMEQAVTLLTPQVSALQEAVASTPSTLRGSRVVFEAKVSPNYLANSYFPTTFFQEADLVPVGTRGSTGEYRTPKKTEESETKTYLLAADERALSKVSRLLSGELAVSATLKRARDSLRQFELLQLPSVEETLRSSPQDGEAMVWEAVFHPLFDFTGERTREEAEGVFEKWRVLVAGLGGVVEDEYARFIKGLTFMPVRLSAEAAREAARFNPLRTIRPMPGIRPLPVSPLRINATGVAAPNPPAAHRPQSDLRVAVFDGGSDPAAPQLTPFVREFELTGEPRDPEFVAHGSLVTSTVLFGPGHDSGELATPEVGVDHFRVLPVPPGSTDLELYWILDRITEEVERGNHKIVNLSLGPDLAVDDDDEPHAWTARLDELAEERDVLFVSAVGNNGELDAQTGANRVQVPADMANGIGVGACDRRPPEADWTRALYSAVGPGRPGCRMQPTGVAFGGVPGRGFRGISAGGAIVEAEGTSFAAPSVVHGLASLSATLGRRGSDPRLLRAVAVHCAEAPSPFDPEGSGFGRLPERFDGLLECAPHEATVLYRDTISRGEAVSLPFPLVSSVVDGRTVTLRWTIALSAPTDPRNPVEYTQAGLEVAFRPHAQRITFTNRDSKKSKIINVAEEAEEARRLISEGYEFSSLPATRSPNQRRHESRRRRDEAKWETMLHVSQKMRSSSLFKPQLTASYLAREEGVLIDAPPLDFVMLLTIQAPRGVDLYDAIRVNYPQLTPLRTELPLRLST